MKPIVCVLRTAGTNCDRELAYAFSRAGATPEMVHVKELIGGGESLDRFHILALPGGFTYGDDVAAGRIMANELRFKLGPALRAFFAQGKLAIGICNGFQIMVKSGLLPGNESMEQEASLIINDSGSFQDRWVHLSRPESRCVWAQGLPELMYLPIAHGEGKFVVRDEALLRSLRQAGQVVFRYCGPDGTTGPGTNPNGSTDAVAGICDAGGRILGLMPHPERHIDPLHHPRHDARGGDGILIIRNGVEYARKHL